ncbi:hypothetical protein GCM10022248_82770 [Nonomuraea soli]
MAWRLCGPYEMVSKAKPPTPNGSVVVCTVGSGVGSFAALAEVELSVDAAAAFTEAELSVDAAAAVALVACAAAGTSAARASAAKVTAGRKRGLPFHRAPETVGVMA